MACMPRMARTPRMARWLADYPDPTTQGIYTQNYLFFIEIYCRSSSN